MPKEEREEVSEGEEKERITDNCWRTGNAVKRLPYLSPFKLREKYS